MLLSKPMLIRNLKQVNDTAAGRSENRRVEMIIQRSQIDK